MIDHGLEIYLHGKENASDAAISKKHVNSDLWHEMIDHYWFPWKLGDISQCSPLLKFTLFMERPSFANEGSLEDWIKTIHKEIKRYQNKLTYKETFPEICHPVCFPNTQCLLNSSRSIKLMTFFEFSLIFLKDWNIYTFYGSRPLYTWSNLEGFCTFVCINLHQSKRPFLPHVKAETRIQLFPSNSIQIHTLKKSPRPLESVIISETNQIK